MIELIVETIIQQPSKRDSDWKMIDLPFNKFKRKRSNNTKLDAQNITRLGIVAYGREYVADISVSTIEFYY